MGYCPWAKQECKAITKLEAQLAAAQQLADTYKKLLEAHLHS